MNKSDKQKNQIIILAVLLLIIGIANYFNYYAPPKPIEEVLSFSELNEKSKNSLINDAKNHKIFNKNKEIENENVNKEIKNLSNKDTNYLNYAIDSNGKLVRWQKNKILVYVSKSPYQSSIYRAFNYYNSVFENYFKFYSANSPQKADIIVDVVDSFSSNTSNDSLYMAGLTNNTITGQDRNLTKSHIQLLSTTPNSNKPLSEKEMFKVALHEIGHSIGIIGHSPNSKDVLYATSGVSVFSERDINTIKMMYSGNNELISTATKNYSKTRIEEAEKYTKLSPKKAIAWENLAKVYYDAGMKEKALDAYKKALYLEPSNPIIYQSMGECYYTSEKYGAAIQSYDTALKYSKTEQERINIFTMIGMCYAKQEKFDMAYPYFREAFNFDNANKSVLKNLLVACVQLDKKEEAKSAISKYSEVTNSPIDDEFINDTLKWCSH